MSVPRRMAQAFSLHDEDGMTTVGMVVSLLLALSMIFSSAQVYRIQSVSSRVQSVADAGALAAGNVVAEFMVAVRVCDARGAVFVVDQLDIHGFGSRRMLRSRRAGRRRQAARGGRARGRCP